ncbi:MAG TPA: 50S ribosomal protein L29 [Pseudoclavibacter sp.]|nr:50S ribosomal protein L29 [Pseudoclavibacter sp.]
MSIGSQELSTEKLDVMDSESLASELKKAKEELFNLRFQAATGNVANNGRVRAVKRDIARIYTVLRERELGIRSIPVKVEASAKTSKAKTKKKAAEAAEATEEAAE